jgi:cytidine deaminase
MPTPIEIKLTAHAYEAGELSENHADLMQQAQEACDNAYAPYSNFHVGAALRLANGKIIKGSNQENAAYPSGLCAERTAIFWTGANHPNEQITAIAITARRKNESHFLAVTPCGSCRQALLEYELKQASPILVILEAGAGKSIIFDSIESLLPMKFSEKDLHAPAE